MVTAFRAGIGAWPMEISPNVHPRFREVIQVSKKVTRLVACAIQFKCSLLLEGVEFD